MASEKKSSGAWSFLVGSKPHYRKGMLAGAIIALAVSGLHSQAFKPGLLGLPGLIAWYLVSLIMGSGAGLIAGRTVNWTREGEFYRINGDPMKAK